MLDWLQGRERERRDALWMLDKLGPAAAKAVPGLQKLLTHKDPAVRQAAAEALKKIRQKPQNPKKPN
jgi:HEAT repeat protein